MLTAIIHTVVAFLLTAGMPAGQAPSASTTAASAANEVTVYRVASCGCCGKWMDHLREAGFTVTEKIVENRSDAPPRARVPEKLQSCHTATVGKYVVEGHVPADVIRDLLAQRPELEGIAVPGMPAGSPGMESPNPEPYEVIAFDGKGNTKVFAKKGPQR